MKIIDKNEPDNYLIYIALIVLSMVTFKGVKKIETKRLKLKQDMKDKSYRI
ncbi:hypothetical protein [Aureibacillus halotolerans]|uniref:Uncharacterized protein n=1 Tax=Aureibacillus halotolerans TaxID=1508390 RepID=A0A4R6U9I3_9BACI|nr:hypothetical protein [Aureibacillus halotolerans]TDQ39734.1 hypothetical protein EV213_107101 [Aureibacillus halotolerans]